MAESEKRDPSQEKNSEMLFIQLVLSFQAAAWQQLGKVPNVMTGKIERNLEMAKYSIDMLGMLETKTKGSLNQDEVHILQHTLFELRMNYLEEMKKGPDKAPEKASEAAPTQAGEGEEKKEGDE